MDFRDIAELMCRSTTAALTKLVDTCLTCSWECPMSLDVHEMVQRADMEDGECILCGPCVDGCTQDTIRFSFSGPKEAFAGGMAFGQAYT